MRRPDASEAAGLRGLDHGAEGAVAKGALLLDAGSPKGTLRQSSPETGGQRNSLLGGVAHFFAPIQPIVRIAREHVQMVVPHILIAGRPVVLARGDAFAAEGRQHRVRQAPRGAEDLVAQVVRHVQHVLVVVTRDHQAVALDAGVVVRRHQGEHVGIHQDNGRFRCRRGQRGGDTAERTVVPGGSVLHEAQRRREPTVGRERILWRALATRQLDNARVTGADRHTARAVDGGREKCTLTPGL